MGKINLQDAFATMPDFWAPRLAGEVNDTHIKLAKFRGTFHWHHHEHEDELFLVVKGRLRINFRDHYVDLDAGEFIVVPRNVEHQPQVIEGECHIMLIERSTTINTGGLVNEHTLTTLERIA